MRLLQFQADLKLPRDLGVNKRRLNTSNIRSLEINFQKYLTRGMFVRKFIKKETISLHESKLTVSTSQTRNTAKGDYEEDIKLR